MRRHRRRIYTPPLRYAVSSTIPSRAQRVTESLARPPAARTAGTDEWGRCICSDPTNTLLFWFLRRPNAANFVILANFLIRNSSIFEIEIIKSATIYFPVVCPVIFSTEITNHSIIVIDNLQFLYGGKPPAISFTCAGIFGHIVWHTGSFIASSDINLRARNLYSIFWCIRIPCLLLVILCERKCNKT